MRIWVTLFLVLFVVFFGAAELYPWLSSLGGSLPGALVAGVLLAIASNFDKLPKQTRPQKSNEIPAASAPTQPSPSPSAPSPVKAVPPQPELRPGSAPVRPPAPSRSISFTIKKPGS